MYSSGSEEITSWVIIPFLGLIVWGCVCLLPWCAYRFPTKSWQKNVSLLLLDFVIFGVFVLQVHLINLFLPPEKSHGGIYFHCFILIEAVGGLVLMFYRGSRERAKCRRETAVPRKTEHC